ncbi:MAG: hypothetical protein ACT4PL_08615 [Phycisphaerales bacterium]
MKVVFRVTEADGSQRESFAVALVGGILVVTGDTEAARRLGVPTVPLSFPVAADPRREPEAYMRALPASFTGSIVRAELIDKPVN